MQDIFSILEWDQILSHLGDLCQTGYGRLLIDQGDFLSRDKNKLRHEMQRVDEAKVLLVRYGDISIQEPPDVLFILERLQKQGGLHSPQELADVLRALKSLRQVVRFVVQNATKAETPILETEVELISIPNMVIDMLSAIVSENGELLESASTAYATLKRKVSDARSGIIQQLQAMIQKPAIAKYLQEPVITEREGRYVLPVKVEHKNDVPGIVLGSSATGSTLYIEPKNIIESQNRLKTLYSELNQEIQRILQQVTEQLWPEVDALMQFIDQVAHLDLCFAKARQSNILNANPVEILEEPGVLKLRQARHPLLVLQIDAVVANDILLVPPDRTLLITGPNTGGKTVLLKLAGIFALMVQAGLHLPVAEGSAISLFHPVLVDIGDPQSIAQNLSTFSGHINRLKAFLDESDLTQSLVLIDEICAGTDPQEGAALAQALLDAFYNRGATTIATTHIGELKVAAHQHAGYLNASVAFDTESLAPTYQLLLGVPGTSHALEIAGRLGIPDDVIQFAEARLTKPQSETAALITDLETKNKKLTEELEATQKLREEIAWEENQLRSQLNRLEGEKRKTLQLFRDGLTHKLRVIEQEVDDLKKALQSPRHGDPKELLKLSKRFKRTQSQVGQVFVEETQKLYPNPGIVWESLNIGDTVSSRTLNLSGTITDKHESRRELTIQAGILKTTIPFSDVIDQQKATSTSKNKQSYTKNQPRPNALTLDCDVRGMTGDDAILFMEKILDDAMAQGYGVVNVVHGLGTGVLKKAIRAHLKTLPYVKSYGPAQAIEGGDGKTIITL